MSTRVLIDPDILTDIADAIREKAGTSGKITPLQMPDAIADITTGTEIDDSVVTFSQVNSTALAYLEQPNYNPTDYTYTYMSQYHNPSDTTLEDPVGKVLTITSGGTIYFVDETTGRGWSDTVSAGSYTVYNLIPNHTYKWWVRTSAGVTSQQGRIMATGALRMIYSQGLHNMRDLGGWSCDGGTVKYGLLLRGAQLSYNNGVLATAADIKRLRDYGIKCEIDLRRAPETAGADGIEGTGDDITSSVLGADVEYLRYRYSDASYVDIVNTSGAYAELTASLMQRIIDNAIRGIPTYIHCAAGADRTGTIACMIEGLLGVAQYDQDRDYELTSFYGITDYERYRTSSNWKALINYISTKSGSTWRDKFVQWALDLGISLDDINAFRSALINGTPATLVASDYTITYSVDNTLDFGISTNNATARVTSGSPYTATLTAATGNNIAIRSIKVSMGGVDITQSAVTLTEYVPSVTVYTIVNSLTHVANSNAAGSVTGGGSYAATLSAEDGYELDSVTVTMGGVDITSTVYSSGTISIPNVTGNIVITATATEAQKVNQIPISTEANGSAYNGGQGYKAGYRLNSSGQESALAGKYVTGFIPVSAGDHISFDGMQIVINTQDNNYIAFYDANHNCLWSKYAYAWYSQTSNIVYPASAEGNYLAEITLTGGTYGGTNYDMSQVAYMRVACNSIDSNSAIYID